MKKVIFLVLFLMTSVFSQEWTKTQKGLFTSFIVANIVDATQTNYALKNTNCIEMNTLYGKNPSLSKMLIYKSVSTGLLYLFADKMPTKERSILLYGLNIFQWGVVTHNSQYVGIKLDFTF